MSAAQEDVIVIGDELRAEKSDRAGGTSALTALNILFLTTTVVGGVGEYFGSVLVAVASMLIFLAYGFVFRKEVPNIERFGDSAYYQGFILTLFALLFALTGKGAHTITSDEIIEKFGLAIWTTCIGMTGRIFIIQFLATVHDQDEEARESISQYIANLNNELQTTLKELSQFRTAITSSTAQIATDLEEESKRNRKEATDSVKFALSTLVRSVEQSSKKLDDSVELVANRISHLDIPADAVSGTIQRIANALEADLNKVRDGLEQGSSRFAETLRGNVSVLEATRDDLAALRATLAEVNNLVSSASKEASASLSNTQANLSASAEAARGIEHLGDMAARLAQRLDQLSTAFDQRAQSYGDQFDRAAKDMAAIVETTREQTTTVASAVVESAQKITSALKEAARIDEPGR